MPPQDGIGNRVPNGIKLLNTDSLVKQVDMTCLSNLIIENGRKDKEVL